MTGAAHPLSAVEVESLRQLRTRLNKPAVSDAAAVTLWRAATQVLARNGVTADDARPAAPASAAAFKREAEAADLAALCVLSSALWTKVETARPGEWRAWQADGAPQALITRRLQLAGRERVEPPC